ncbi:MAG: hypothetical protein UFG06_08425 [Lachnospiraceae bacterium]|nr:hypothetical protein [Lachnospiraceae bacterium]
MNKKFKIYIVLLVNLIMLVLFVTLWMMRSREISWEGDYYGEEYTHGENGVDSYDRLAVALHIEDLGEKWHIELEIKRYLGSKTGLDVTVLNIISNETDVQKQSADREIHFSLPSFPHMEDTMYVIIKKESENRISIKYAEQDKEWGEASSIYLMERN